MSEIIDKLLAENIITPEQLDEAIALRRGSNMPLETQLLQMGFVEQATINKYSDLATNAELDLENLEINPYLVELLPQEKAKKYKVVPLKLIGDDFYVGSVGVADLLALDDLQILTDKNIKAKTLSDEEFKICMDKAYSATKSMGNMLKNYVGESEVRAETIADSAIEQTVVLDSQETLSENSPVIRLVNLIFSDAIKNRASDIHIEPHEDHMHVRYRIDGRLRNIMTVPIELRAQLTARIKIIAGQDIAETRKTQDGRARLSVGSVPVDLRVSTIPTFYGEKIVMRLLGTENSYSTLDKLGFESSDMELFEKAIVKPQGMVLVTGPTGSGKTSTLYAALNQIKGETKNIVTIEDPIEYVVDGVNQIEVNPVKDVTFASGLKSILRQDPNVILVGEIRDMETAEIAFRSSLTGHLVLSTLHTNSSIATIIRLKDIGLESYLISSSLNIIIAQRLVRLLCPHCKVVDEPEAELLSPFADYIKQYGIDTFYASKGCQKCEYSGFAGRTAVFEVCSIDETMRSMIARNADVDDLYKYACKNGMKTLAEAGYLKAAAGMTSLMELRDNVPVDEFLSIQEDLQVAVPDSPNQEPDEIKREKPLVLLVDDEDSIRRLLDIRFKHSGYDTLLASNGKEALESAVRFEPDLIVMDVMMPIMDGIEALKELRSNLKTAVVPVIMLTAKSAIDDELAGFDAGADDYVSKPFDMERLLARVQALLRRRSF